VNACTTTFFTRQINTEQFRTGRAPFYATGGGLTANPTNNTYTATNAFVTTDNVEKPGFRVRARRLTIVPGKYFVARDAVLYFGKAPVFYSLITAAILTGTEQF